MRTNIDIDDALMKAALEAGPFKTKKDAVEAGLELLVRQAAYREILKWRGKLQWEGDDASDWTTQQPEPAHVAMDARAGYAGRVASTATAKRAKPSVKPSATPSPAPSVKRRAGR